MSTSLFSDHLHSSSFTFPPGFSQICSMPGDELEYQAGRPSSLSSSVMEITQMGVKLTTSTTTWFGDMNHKKKSIFGELSLSPLFFDLLHPPHHLFLGA